MTTELTYLIYAAALTTVLWMPYIVGQIALNGMLTPRDYANPTPRPAPRWVERANRVHLNSVETLAPFAVGVFAAHLAGVSTEMTALWAIVFFWARVGHAVVYLLGAPYLRTLLFFAGFVATLGLFWEILTAGAAA